MWLYVFALSSLSCVFSCSDAILISIPLARGADSHALWLTCQVRLCAQIRTKLRDLQLDDELVWKREEAREASPEWVKAPWFIQAFYILLCWVRAALLPSTQLLTCGDRCSAMADQSYICVGPASCCLCQCLQCLCPCSSAVSIKAS